MKKPGRPHILAYVNSVIALLLLAALGVVYWFAWRPLPRRSGEIQAPVSQSVTVRFDARGVPHIRGATLEDALFVQGYVTAQDRLWQMDALRRYDAGELSEVIGPTMLETDRESRRMRFRRVAEAAYLTLPADDRAAFAAYTRGVNEFIATHLNSLPVEFTLLGYQPRPWSAIDSLLVCMHMFRVLTNSWREELLKQDMLSEGDRAKVEFLFPLRSGADPLPGSNAWAVSGAHTASGKPLLSNDMHLEYSLPGIWYMAHLQAPGLDVSGVALPGVPGIIVGHNQRIAWGITNLGFDVQDLCLANFDAGTGRYQVHGKTEQATLERDIIRVKGRPPVELPVWVTRYGPLFASENGRAYILRWVLAEPGLVQFPMLDIDRAQNWQQFTAALARFAGPGSNFAYADVDGNIGYHAAGRLPIRRGFRGDVPVDLTAGDADWDGFIPFDRLPQTFNPPDGIIATANQNPFPADYPYPVNGYFAAPYRARQIRDRLSGRGGLRAEDMLSVQKDVYSHFHHFLAQQAVAAYNKSGSHTPLADQSAALLRSWNGQMDKDLAAPFVAALLFQRVRALMVGSAAPGKELAYTPDMSSAVVENLLRTRPAGWFDNYDSMLAGALSDSAAEAERIQGRNVARWKYGNYMKIGIEHPVVHQIPWIGSWFDIAPVPMSGAGTTVRASTRRLAPSMRMDADLSDWDRSLLNVQTGESGHILSGHYRDEWPDWYYGRSYPMEFRDVRAASTLTFRP